MNQNSGLYICGTFTQGSPLANLFVSDSITKSPLTSAQLAAFSTSITNLFEADQRTLYGNIAQDLKSGSGTQSANFLTGTKSLAQAYASFGLPGSMQTNDVLQGLLYGSGSILDGATVQSDFAGFSSSSISNSTDNKITDEISLLNSLSTALGAAFANALSLIQRSGTPDSPSQIDQTIEDLQAFENVQNANALSACSYQLSSGSSTIGSSGGSATITVSSVSGCGVIASSGAPWLNVSTTQSRPGQFQVSVNVMADPSGSARSGIVIAGDQIYRVFQDTTPTIGQNNRSFVSTTGSDANSCSVNAPCRTLADAISQTSPGGEVVLVDSGGYGAVTITQPVTITAIGVDAAITATSGNAVTINTTGNVTINGLGLHGGEPELPELTLSKSGSCVSTMSRPKISRGMAFTSPAGPWPSTIHGSTTTVMDSTLEVAKST